MYLRRLWIIILLRYSKEKRRADETMDGQNQANRADGQLGERKKDDCGYNYTQFKAASQETLGAAVNRNVAVVCAFQK